MQDQVIDPRQTDTPTELHQTVDRGCEHHNMAFIVQDIITEVKHPRYPQGQEDARANYLGIDFQI